MDEKSFQPSAEGAGRPMAAGDNEIEESSRTWDSTLEPDSDTDSDGETSIKSTRSLPVQNIESIIENDRRYCNDTYFMPNDEAEQTRLNIINQIYLIVLGGKLTTVPIPNDGPRILDIGTGPGDWALEMSEQYPDAKIIASDIGVFETGLGDIALPNVSFQLDDARDEWTYHEPFDLIHIRGLSGAFPDWSLIYEQAFKHIKPGGYIEVADADPAGETVTFPNSGNSYLHIYSSAMQSAARAAGYPRDLGHLRSTALSSAGFVDVRVLEHTIPIGLWPTDPHEKTLGKMALIALLEGLEAYSLRQLTATGRWTPDGVRDLCEKVKVELLTATKMTARVCIVAARKPMSREATRQREK